MHLGFFSTKEDSNLITLDIPQLFTAHTLSSKTMDIIDEFFHEVQSIRHNVGDIHLGGKRLSANVRKTAHIGDLDSYFNYNNEHKKKFLQLLYLAFGDDTIRYFVPEVNSSNENLKSIIDDLINSNFVFINKN